MPPWQFGGEMIDQVFLDRSTFAPPPLRFEPGTPAIEQVVGLGAAVDYLSSIGGMEKVHEFEMDLGSYLYEKLAQVDDIVIYGPPPDARLGRAALAAFNIEGLHATDVSMLLDAAGVYSRFLMFVTSGDSGGVTASRITVRRIPFRSSQAPTFILLAIPVLCIPGMIYSHIFCKTFPCFLFVTRPFSTAPIDVVSLYHCNALCGHCVMT
jgi:hypothetical protein